MAAASNPQSGRRSTARPGFHHVNGRRLFGLEIVPTGTCHGAVLYLPPHVEEMNRCRSHVVLQARALAARGWHCLLLDPHGTGESDGETDAADWDHWRADAAAAAAWLAQQTGHAPTLWGLRTGALLAAELATSAAVPVAGLLLWQPVLDGKLYLNQYLRLRIASQLVRDGEKETTDSIRARLAAGEVVEVAGYPLTGRMADALAARSLAGFGSVAGLRIDWLEVVARPEQPLGLPSRKLADSWTATGARVATTTVADPMIWQLQERDDAPALQAASLQLMEAGR
ncbi:MAG: hydrolase 2, exosortase A system-associated [Pseudomonadota bacterium]